MARISKVVETKFTNLLKKWFRPEKYEPARKFGAYDWLLQVAFRRDVHSLILKSRDNPNFRAGDHQVGDFVGAIHKNPLIPNTKLEQAAEIVELTIGRSGHQGRLLCFPSCSDVLGLKSYRRRGVWCSENPNMQIGGSCFTTSFRVEIDMPDSVLLEQFEQELKIARRMLKLSNAPFIGVDQWGAGPINRIAFAPDKWFGIALLPYLDVRLTTLLENGPEIPPAVLRKNILPAGEPQREHVITAVTQPHADSLLEMDGVEFRKRISAMRL